MIHDMKHGETRRLGAGGQEYFVNYYADQSLGDNGKPVRGATVGHFNVQWPGGSSNNYHHGPHATTPQAAKRGANPNAKTYAAEEAMKAITNHARTAQSGMAGVFRDKRRI